jgi:hypothetical protein
MPAPTPVPRITPNTISTPAAAPSVASEIAKQLASFAIRTARPRASSTSRWSGRPISQTELAFFTTPLAGLIVPGMPIPTVAVTPTHRSRSAISVTMASTVAR